MDFPLITFNPETGLAEVGIPKSARVYRGIDKLIQIVTVAVLKNGGQDVFDPNAGTGLRSMLGQFNYYSPDEIKIEVIQRINKIKKQIIENHTGFNLPSTEKLADLKVLSVIVDSVTGAAAVNLQVVNEAGQSKVAVV